MYKQNKISVTVNANSLNIYNTRVFQTFKTRFRLVMDWAQNPVSDPTLGSQLPLMERQLFLTGRKARAQLIEWLKQGGGNIETSEVVSSLMKKRKRIEF